MPENSLTIKFGVISTDDHLQEAPHVWTERMSKARFGDDIPHIVSEPDGSEHWLIAGQPVPGLLALGEVQGAREDRAAPPTHWSEIPTKTYVPVDRLRCHGRGRRGWQTFFPNIAGITNGTFQKIGTEDYRLACIRATTTGRPRSGTRSANGSFLNVSFHCGMSIRPWPRGPVSRDGPSRHIGNPAPEVMGFPHLNEAHWDPLWATCEDLGMVVSFHVGGGAPVEPWSGYTQNQAISVRSCRVIAGNSLFMANLLYSGILERFPRLKFSQPKAGSVDPVPFGDG